MDKKLFFGLDSLFAEIAKDWLPTKDFGEKIHRWKIFTSPVTAFLFIAQKLTTRNSLSGALCYFKQSEIGGGIDRFLLGSRRLALKDIGTSTGGLSQARSRLSIKATLKMFDSMNRHLALLNRKVLKEKRENKRKWFLLDGSTIGLERTAAIKEKYPALSNQYGECQPCTRVVFAHNLFDAVAERPVLGKMSDSEQELAKKVIRKLPFGSGIIADKNFGVFSIAHSAFQRGLRFWYA